VAGAGTGYYTRDAAFFVVSYQENAAHKVEPILVRLERLEQWRDHVEKAA
jgi:hypothetical protein